MSTNEAYLTRCPKCGQYLFEEDSKNAIVVDTKCQQKIITKNG